MKADEFVVGLDLGTTKICAVVAQLTDQSEAEGKDRAFKILAVGKSESSGIKKGVVVNIEETVEGIRKAVQEAELMAGVEISKVLVGVGGSHVKGINSTGVVGIKGKEIEKGDIDRVIDAARAIAIPPDRLPIHILPQEYKVDDQDGIRDPLGMMGVRLESSVHIVTAAQSATQNIIRCCQKTGLSVESMVLQPLASARAVLSKDEKELGVALVDIGGGSTNIAIFHGGSIVHTAVLAIGGSHITQDLAIGLRTPQGEAEKLKIKAGCALKQMISANETVEVPSVGGRPARIVDRKMIGEIIEPRMEEILQLVNREIIASGCSEILGGGVVLTGGCTEMEGLTELAEFVFDLPIKRAYPENLEGFADMVSTPAYSAAVGLTQWGIDSKLGVQRRGTSRGQGLSKVGSQVKNFFADLF